MTLYCIFLTKFCCLKFLTKSAITYKRVHTFILNTSTVNWGHLDTHNKKCLNSVLVLLPC